MHREDSLAAETDSAIQPAPAQRIAWAILIALTLYVCYFSHLDVIGFVGPDEPRYAWIARDMAESGDWITPRLYGRPWFEKPPLLYWGGAFFFKLLGEGRPEIAARLPSAISALFATLALAWLAWRTYGEECARWLLLLLPTSVGMIGFSHACATDMPFAGMLTIAMVCAAVILGLIPASQDTSVLPRTPWLALILFGFFEGLAVLAKGPAALILTGGAVFFWALFTKRWRDAFRLLHPAAIATFSLTALPWYILCARRNPDFFRVFIIEHNFKRYLTPEFQHTQPFWFYIPIVFIALTPWIGAVLWSLVVGFARLKVRTPLSAQTVLYLSWALLCIVFFSLSKSKLPGYILPAFPPIAAVLSRSIESTALEKYSSFQAFGQGTLLVCLTLSYLVSGLPRQHETLEETVSLVLLLVGFANLFLGLSSTKRAFVRVYQVAVPLPVLCLVLLAGELVPPLFVHNPSGKTVASELASEGIATDRLFVHDPNRGMHFGLNFYLRREIRDWDPGHSTDGYLLLGGKNCAQLVSPSHLCEEPPIHLKRSERFVYQVRAASLPTPNSGRQPQ